MRVAAKVSETGVKVMAAAAVPVPESPTMAWPPEMLAKRVSWPVRAPVAVGAKLICTVQKELTARVWWAQLSVSVKSPVTMREPKVSGELPELVTVRVCAADCVETCCGANEKFVAESVRAGAASVAAVSSGCCQRPRPLVAARNMPRRPSPVGMLAAAERAMTGALGSAVPSGLQQLALEVEQERMAVVT